MLLVLKFREWLSRLGQPLVDELEQLIAAIQTGWKVEHADDGTHLSFTSPTAAITTDGNITADGSVTVVGDVTAGDGYAAIGSLEQAATPSASGGYLRLKSLGGLSHWRISAWEDTDDELRIADLNQAIDDYVLRLKLLSGSYYFSPAAGVALTLGRDAVGERLTDIYSLDAHFSNGVYERSRSARMGEWTGVTYAGTDFTASTGTWTVDSGDVGRWAYMVIGKTMFVSFRFNTTSTSATPTTLKIAIPGGFTATGTTNFAFNYNANGTVGVGYGSVSGGTTIDLARDMALTAWPLLTNTLSVNGSVAFQVS